MDVRIASEYDKERWDTFVDRQGGSFFQYFDWKYIYEMNSSKHRLIPLIVENNSSEIVGIFPTKENLTLPYGSLLSLPLNVSNDFLITDNSGEVGKKNILQTYLDYIDIHYYGSHSSLVLREFLPLSEQTGPISRTLIENGFTMSYDSSKRLPCTHILRLEKPFHEKIWTARFSTKLRQRIRHVKKSNVKVIIDEDLKYKDDFIEMQIQTAKKFGVVENREVLNQTFRIFQKRLKLFILLLDAKPIAGTLCFYTPTMAYQAMAPYLPIAEDYLTNTLPVCVSIRYTCNEGYHYYEMGISPTETLAYYKEKFGATRIPLMIYQKEFSHFKVIANKVFSRITGLARKYFKT